MSRINSDYEDYSDNPYFDQGRWQHNVQQATFGKRGQAALREVEAALLALPEPRLVPDYLCTLQPVSVTDDGELDVVAEFCVLGALAAHRGKALTELERAATWLESDDWETARWAHQNLGLTETLAYTLMNENDEGPYASETPEQRFARVLGWVQSAIRPYALPQRNRRQP
jgi:hypothetical protein